MHEPAHFRSRLPSSLFHQGEECKRRGELLDREQREPRKTTSSSTVHRCDGEDIGTLFQRGVTEIARGAELSGEVGPIAVVEHLRDHVGHLVATSVLGSRPYLIFNDFGLVVWLRKGELGAS